MKIIKRSGCEVDFDITKIIAAITKGNNEMREADKLTAAARLRPKWRTSARL